MMKTSQQKREILAIITTIEDALEEIEVIIADMGDTELYESTVLWLDKAFKVIDNGAHSTIVQIDKLDKLE